MQQRMISLILLLFISCAFLGFSVPLSNIASEPDDVFPLSNTKKWEGGNPPELDYLPDVPGASELLERYHNFEPEVMVQRLYRFSLPLRYSGDIQESRELLFKDLLGIFLTPDSQVGYTYFSTSQQEEKPLFEESFISDSRGRPAEPPVVSSLTIPGSVQYYQFVDETNLSGAVFSQNLDITSQFFSYQSYNEERLWYKFLPIMGAGEMRNDLLVFLADDYLYLYNSTQVKKEPAAKKIGLPIHIPAMTKKRMDVMVQWLMDRLSLL